MSRMSRSAPPDRVQLWSSGWAVAAKLAVVGQRRDPRRAASTVAVLATAVALVAIDHHRQAVEAVLQIVAITVAAVTALAATTVPDPARLRTGALLHQVGAPRAIGRRIAVVDVGLSAALAVGPGLVLGAALAWLFGAKASSSARRSPSACSSLSRSPPPSAGAG